jgi:programmed cell death 8 (apoptosis-inducing factor)
MVAAVRGTGANHPVLRYRHQPCFRSHLPGTGLLLEGIGTVDAKLTTVGVWLASRDERTGEAIRDETHSRGIIYYLKGNVVVGAVAVNASECIGLLREVLNEQRVVADYKSLRRRVQLAPEHWLKVIVTNPRHSSCW